MSVFLEKYPIANTEYRILDAWDALNRHFKYDTPPEVEANGDPRNIPTITQYKLQRVVPGPNQYDKFLLNILQLNKDEYRIDKTIDGYYKLIIYGINNKNKKIIIDAYYTHGGRRRASNKRKSKRTTAVKSRRVRSRKVRK